MHLAYVALGANLDDPVAQVRAAFEALRHLPQSRLTRTSSLYRTAPVGVHGQPDFINAVAQLETDLDAAALLDALLAIEASSARRRDSHLAPRTLDHVLLLFDDAVIDTPRLALPHPRMHLRAFVMAPLAEIAPDCRIPGRGSVAAWLPAVRMQRIERMGAMETHGR